VFETLTIEQNYKADVSVGNSGLCLIDAHSARSIARRFLEQHNSLIIFKDATLKGKIWTVIMDVGLQEEHIRHVNVDAETGNIMGYS
jgi:hypothetical protein